MRAIHQKRHGVLYQRGAQVTLLLDGTGEAPTCYLRFALITIGSEDPIFPALLLDDWGNEIKKLALYDWLRQNGTAFPRAELFGFDAMGRETQVFLRDLELYARYPCYAFRTRTTPLAEGVLISRVLLAQPGVSVLRAVSRPSDVSGPLRRAQVSWWEVDPAALPALGYVPIDAPAGEASG